jgi:hypothetical protein
VKAGGAEWARKLANTASTVEQYHCGSFFDLCSTSSSTTPFIHPAPRHLHALPTMAETESFLHLARPLGPAPIGAQPSTAPLSVVIQPQVQFPFNTAQTTPNTCSGHLLHSGPLPPPPCGPRSRHRHPPWHAHRRRHRSRDSQLLCGPAHRDCRAGRG